MTNKEFRMRVAATNRKIGDPITEACRLVLIEGLTGYQAWKETGVSQAHISRALRQLRAAKPATHCPKCGGAVR